jgi:hypothetical protein
MTERKSTKKTTRKKKSTASSASKKSTTRKRTASKTSKRKSTSTSRQRVTLRGDLDKFASEEYGAAELLRGGLLIVEREGAEIVRQAVVALLASKIPLFGGSLGDEAIDGVIRKLTDDYRKVKADERKAMRAVVNWLRGSYEVDTRTANELLAALNRTPGATSS